MTPIKARALTLALSIAGGAAVWALAPRLAGTVEPWDSESFYYPAALAVVGFVIGLVRPPHVLVHYVGVFLGQLAFSLLFVPAGPLVLVGVAFLAGYSLVALACFAAGTGIRDLVLRFTAARQ